jgi:TonB family protein
MFTYFIRHEQFTAIALATIFHASLGLCVVISGYKNISSLPQSLQVSLVAPSKSLKLNSQSAIDIKPKDHSFEKTGIQSVKQNAKNDGEESIARKTSGKENPNAKALNSAVTEPIFNAVYLNNSAPVYPAAAKRDGIQGKVLLLVEISVDGLAKSVQISESSGYSSLDNAAKAAVLSWKFIPAKQYGKAIDASALVPIEFKLS